MADKNKDDYDALERLFKKDKERLGVAKELETIKHRIANELAQEADDIEKILTLEDADLKLLKEKSNYTEKLRNEREKILKTHKLGFNLLGNELVREANKLKIVRALSEEAKKGNVLAKTRLQLIKAGEKIQKGIEGVISKVADKTKQMGNEMVDFLMNADKAIKSVNVGIGLVGNRADDFRLSMEKAVGSAAQYGASTEDLVQIQSAYNEQLSTATTMTSKQMVDLVKIAKSTGVSMDNIGQMAADYQKMGGSAEDFKNYVEDASNSSRALGLNSGKVLSNITKNMDKLNTFNFKKGREGLKNMAQDAAKMNVSMEGIFSSAEQAQTLEGSMEMAAKLNVLGGEFAKADPFKLLHDGRNDMESYNKGINQMTKGMVVFNKEQGKLGMSMVDTQRMKLAAEALSIPYEDLLKKATANAKEEMANVALKTKGFDKKDQELLTNLSEVNGKGQMEIKIGDTTKLLSQVDAQDVKRLKSDKVSADKLAKDNQTFNELFANLLLEFKSLALPVLNKVNDLMKWVNGMGDGFGSLIAKIAIVGGALLLIPMAFAALGAVITAPLTLITAMMGALVATMQAKVAGGIVSSVAGTVAGGIGQAVPLAGAIPAAGATVASGASTVASGASTAAGAGASTAAGAGASGAKKLGGAMSGFAGSALALGGAMLMLGAGIGLAALGISYLADSFAKLNPEQISGLKEVLLGLGIAILGFGVILGIMAIAGATAVLPLLAFGGAILLIGAGIGLAALGMSSMATSMSGLIGKNAGAELIDIASGIMAINGAILAGTFGIVGAIGFASVMSSIQGINDINFKGMEDAFGQANKFVTSDLSALDKLAETFKSMENLNLEAVNTVIQQMKEMQDKGMVVRFENENVNLTVNTEIKIDSSVIAREVAKATVRIKVGK